MWNCSTVFVFYLTPWKNCTLILARGGVRRVWRIVIFILGVSLIILCCIFWYLNEDNLTGYSTYCYIEDFIWKEKNKIERFQCECIIQTQRQKGQWCNSNCNVYIPIARMESILARNVGILEDVCCVAKKALHHTHVSFFNIWWSGQTLTMVKQLKFGTFPKRNAF